MLSAVSTECTVINASLAMLQNLMLGNIDDLQSRMVPEVLATFDTALQGCCLTLSVIEEELKSLLVCEEKGDVVPKRLKYILEKEHLKELLLQLRGQQSGVSLLLQMYQAYAHLSYNIPLSVSKPPFIHGEDYSSKERCRARR